MDIIDRVIHLLWEAGQWLIIGVGINYLLRKKVGDIILDRVEKHPLRYQRYLAIWHHHQDRARGNGHKSRNVLACGESRCVAL